MSSVAYKQADYKSDVKPIWCPGCGDYHVLMSFGRAFAQLGLPPEKIAVISGIGCSSRIPAYTNCYGFHGVHGRSLALAAGLKVTRPDLTVVVASGDGDGYSIGGNHFLHACRRNIDMTYVVMDNHIYGMTKGQPSPTTEPEFDTALSPAAPAWRHSTRWWSRSLRERTSSPAASPANPTKPPTCWRKRSNIRDSLSSKSSVPA